MGKAQLAILAAVAACVTTLAAIAGSAAAGPFTVATPTLISAPSPFTNCNNIGPGATNYLNAEVEPWVAVSIPPPGHAYPGIALSKSTDGGLTWSAPVQVNQRPDVQAFTAAVEVADDGTVGVTYYDFRNNTSDPATLPTDYFIVHSHDGGLTFGDEAHVAGPFDMKTAPRAGGFFVGDYEGLATIGNTFIPVFVQANSGNTANRADVFETTAGP